MSDLPKGWKETTLEQVVTKLGDGLHGTPKYSENGDYYFINGNNLSNGRIAFDEKTRKVSREEFRKYKKNLNDRTILVSINGTLGNVAFYNGEKVVLGKSACYFNVKDDVNKSFIRYLLSTKYFHYYIHKFASGTTIKNLSLKAMREFPFSIPPLPEQKAIADILSSFDEKIELLREQNKTLENIAQTLFKEWFVNFNYPGATGQMQQSPLGPIPKGWKVFCLRDLVRQVRPGTNYQPKRTEFGIPFINGRNVKAGFLDLSDVKRISESEYHRVHKKWKPEKNDVLITRIGTLGNVGVIRENDLPVAVHYNSIDIKDGLIPYQFVYFLLKSDYFQEQFHLYKKQAVQEFITIEAVEDIKLFFPRSISCDNEFFVIFKSLFNKIHANQDYLELLSKTRDSVLQKLLTGALRVSLKEVD